MTLYCHLVAIAENVSLSAERRGRACRLLPAPRQREGEAVCPERRSGWDLASQDLVNTPTHEHAIVTSLWGSVGNAALVTPRLRVAMHSGGNNRQGYRFKGWGIHHMPLGAAM